MNRIALFIALPLLLAASGCPLESFAPVRQERFDPATGRVEVIRLPSPAAETVREAGNALYPGLGSLVALGLGGAGWLAREWRHRRRERALAEGVEAGGAPAKVAARDASRALGVAGDLAEMASQWARDRSESRRVATDRLTGAPVPVSGTTRNGFARSRRKRTGSKGRSGYS